MKKSVTEKFVSIILVILVLAVVEPMGLANAARSDFGIAQYVVKIKPGSEMLFRDNGLLLHPVFTDSHSDGLRNIYVFDSDLPLAALTARFGLFSEYIHLDDTLYAAAVSAKLLPNDPGFSKDPENIDRQWGLHKSNFPGAWAKTTGSKNVVVAVIDTGIDTSHKDFKHSRFVPGKDILEDTTIRPGSDSDDNGHGTLVAGVIGATTNNRSGISGAGWNVRIMPVKALKASGSGRSSNVAKGIVWAVDNGADVINLSMGGNPLAQDTVLSDAIRYAYGEDVVIVAAAGNDSAVEGRNLDVEPVFPVCDDNGRNMVIGVSAIDSKDIKPAFANFGKACIDVVAPGKRILSTTNHDPANGSYVANAYAYASGTSMAAPFVSAQAALLRSLFPTASSRQIRDRIIATSKPVDDLNLTQCAGGSCLGLLGGGRIDAEASLAEQLSGISDRDLVVLMGTDNHYFINGSKRQPVSPFVLKQRFSGTETQEVTLAELSRYSEGSFATPLEGTLVKSVSSPAVYIIDKGLKLPISAEIFRARNLRFMDVIPIPDVELNSWVTGSWLLPPAGSLIRGVSSQTVYLVSADKINAVSYDYWMDRGLNKLPLMVLSDELVQKLPKGDSFTLSN